MSVRLVFLACYVSVVAFANTQISQIRVTNTQAVVWVHTDQTGNCTFVVSESSSLSPVVNDVNETLFPGSSSDARAGSVIQANDHWFVVGTRAAAPGATGQWYSRALAADTAHYGTATCGADAAVPFQLTTSKIPTGVTYTDPVPFDVRGLGNYAVPTFDFTDVSKMYVDPQTGYKFRLVTGPGQAPAGTNLITGSLSGTGNAGGIDGKILTSSNWTNPNNCLVVDGSACSYTASAQDVLTVRLASTCGPGGCQGDLGWHLLGNVEDFRSAGIDSYQLALTCDGGGSTIQVDVAYSWNNVSQGSEWETQTCPSSSGTVTYPSSLNGAGTAAWQGPNYPLIPAVFWNAMQKNYTVNTSGVTVTATGPTFFPLDTRILTAGSFIKINGVEYTVALVNSATSITLTGSAGTQSNVAAQLAGFSVMIRKHSGTAGTLNVDGATVKLALSDTFSNGGSGFQIYCSGLTSTDAEGHVGHFCTLNDTTLIGAGIYWVTEDLQARYIGRGHMQASSIGVPQDEYAAQFYTNQSAFDATDPNSWWVSSTLNATGQTTLIKATYNPAGASGCMQTADYQQLPLDPNYDSNNMINCNITYTELTRPSLGRGIWSQLPPAMTSGKFGISGPGFSFTQNGVAIMSESNGGDTEAWIATIDLSTGMVRGVFSTYMNTSSTVSSDVGSYPCRACVYHAPETSDGLAPYWAFIANNYFGGTTTGAGPYQITVNTALSTTPAMNVAMCQAAVGTDGKAYGMIQYSQGCDTITLAGSDNIPCDPTPSAWESANMPACSWQGGWTQWQAGGIMVGDEFVDPVTGFEQGMFEKFVGGTTWIIARNIDPPHAANMTSNGFGTGYMRNHSTGWTLSLVCNYPGYPLVSTAETNGAGIIFDRYLNGPGHTVFTTTGSIGAYPTGSAVRVGAIPAAVNTPLTANVLSNAPFGTASALGLGGNNFVQSHPGWTGGLSFYTDFAPLAPSFGGSFTLWPQTGVTNVAGSLYKIPAASAYLAPIKRYRSQAVWAGMYNFQDISGASAISGNTIDNYKYCSIDYAGATCGQTGESAGDVFMNIPQATIDGVAGGTYDYNRANAIPLGQEPLGVLQYYFNTLNSANAVNDGRWERRITTAFGRYNGQDTYSNSKVIPGSSLLLFNCGTPNLQRLQDLCVGKMPSDDPPSPASGSGFYNIAITAPARGQYAEIQFGYAENGGPSQFYCTSRQEACNTSSPSGIPYNWEGETRSLTSCASGCTLQIPAIPGRIVYYRLRWSNDGMIWTNSSVGVTTAPANPSRSNRF